MSQSGSVTEILLDLIAIPSVSSASNQAVIDYARERLKPNQWEVRTFPYTDPNGIEKTNLIAVAKKRLQPGGREEQFGQGTILRHSGTPPATFRLAMRAGQHSARPDSRTTTRTKRIVSAQRQSSWPWFVTRTRSRIRMIGRKRFTQK